MSSMSPLEFDELLRIRAKEMARKGVCALGPMYDLVATRLLRYSSTITKTREEAEDVLQSSLLRLARKPKQLSSASRPWSYLLRLVRNEAYDQLYRKKTAGQLEAFPQLTDPVEVSLDSWERHESVHQAIQQLPVAQAEVVTLKIWEGMSFREIAEVTDEPLHTIASRYRYAMGKLAALLKSHNEETEAESKTVKSSGYRVCARTENDLKK